MRQTVKKNYFLNTGRVTTFYASRMIRSKGNLGKRTYMKLRNVPD